ncbi:MAG: hypothetical protein HZA03_11115 [Nitrospinae bacterium]|nr:hypothetical protein [Nitrospinota bacterium]
MSGLLLLLDKAEEHGAFPDPPRYVRLVIDDKQFQLPHIYYRHETVMHKNMQHVLKIMHFCLKQYGAAIMRLANQLNTISAKTASLMLYKCG